MNSAVSIITPTYNRAQLLPRVWASLLKQTERQFQWIVVDDGSTDNTREVVQDFNDPRITYIWQENQGVNGARNRGEQEISAEYVIYLDSDDELYNESTLREMLKEIRATRPEIAWVAFTVVDSEGRSDYNLLTADRLETSYIDHACEQKIRGEFFPIYRRDVIRISSWPPFNGMEALRHWRIIKQRPALIINRPARVYHKKVGDNLTGAHSVVRRSEQMVEATSQLIIEHKLIWLTHCPNQLGNYYFYRALYLAVSVTGLLALPDLLRALRYGNSATKTKAIVVSVNLLLPLRIRQWLFTNVFRK
jgi:hypothetical protein